MAAQRLDQQAGLQMVQRLIQSLIQSLLPVSAEFCIGVAQPIEIRALQPGQFRRPGHIAGFPQNIEKIPFLLIRPAVGTTQINHG